MNLKIMGMARMPVDRQKEMSPYQPYLWGRPTHGLLPHVSPDHLQWVCSHMDCSIIKTFQGMQVGRKAPSDWFIVPIQVKGQETWALVDRECCWTLVRRAKGPWTPKILRINWIHGDA